MIQDSLHWADRERKAKILRNILRLAGTAREALITSFYVEWNHNNLEHRVFNDDLNDYIYVTYLSLDETRRHAAKRHQSTLAVLQLNTILRTAKHVGKPFPVKPGSKNQKSFSKMLRMECQLEGIGLVKLLVGMKKKTGDMVQYCITALEPQQ